MIIHAKEKKERALGEKLFLKAHRCNSPKCSMTRRPYRPGVHGKNRRKVSDYGVQLNAKQKLKVIYGLNESQLTNIFRAASRNPEATGQKMTELLERRLDNLIFRSAIADSRPMAKNLISRGHILVNGKKTVSPSCALRRGDVVSVRPESKDKGVFKNLGEKLKKAVAAPSWFNVDPEKLEVKISALPADVDLGFDISGVIEFFAKNN
ncbi:MAG: 30S ribosomal protein S4 [Candidatus Liptonbacteria bacterium]|nr:30S ribosomal protein S4 [Candidatus Liptonbacteria bacterium]